MPINPDDHIHKQGTDDGWHGQITSSSSSSSSSGPFPPEQNRYHMYIGLFCPFAHRANLVRHLAGLTDTISLSIVKPYPKGDDKGWPGWKFPTSNDLYEGATQDHLFGSEYLHEVYFRDDKDYKGRYSVPLIWDKQLNRAVSNESAEILRWLPLAFDDSVEASFKGLDLYPAKHRETIDHVGEWMQTHLNAGVYKAGFATTQEDYDKNVIPVFAALNTLEDMMHANGGPYLLGDHLTELDLRLYATVIRFDVVYVQHFKCNLGTIRGDYPVIENWLRRLYWDVPGFKETTDFRHIKENYTKSHAGINPHAITPMGPFPDIREGYERDWSKVKPGGVRHPDVLAFAKGLK